jgi:serine/threonine-protein kinase HipA
MSWPVIQYCPGTLAEGYDTYSRICLKKMYGGIKVSHILPYDAPNFDEKNDLFFEESTKRISISGVQEKYSVLLEKNKLRIVNEGEKGTYILKPIPTIGKRSEQLPANEHLTMQIASQVFGIETAENALIFFRNGTPAYITKRFDVKADGSKLAQEDFASVAGRTPQTQGEHYKYKGNYFEIFELMRRYLPLYSVEAPKLFKLVMFNYLFSNGDAHYKNFSILETAMGDFRLSPAYDLLNTRIHIEDADFALEEGLLPKSLAQGTIKKQFVLLGKMTNLTEKQINNTFNLILSNADKVEKLINASFLNDSTKRSYLQLYQGKLKKLGVRFI